jgi:predicted nucleotidyltransferase
MELQADASNGLLSAFLDKVERECKVRVVFAIEAGSRTWGTASKTSDYDVRFVFCRPVTSYCRLVPEPDTLERKEGLFDAHGWDVRKALGLALGGNGAIAEWLRSPIVYRNSLGLLKAWRRELLPRMPRQQVLMYYHSLLQRERKLCVGGRREIEDLKAKRFLSCVGL